MKIIIDIPSELEIDYKRDKFCEFFFKRVYSDADSGLLCDKCEQEIAIQLLGAFQNSNIKNSCNCKCSNNLKDNDPCHICDNRKTNDDKSMTDEVKNEIAAVLGLLKGILTRNNVSMITDDNGNLIFCDTEFYNKSASKRLKGFMFNVKDIME